jgi:dihydrolipoamide dehydrogenase
VEYLFKTNGIDVIKGEGKISGPGNVIVNGTLYSAENIIIGTGSIPKVPKGFENCITSDGALELKELPEKITIIGSGAVGIEFACIFNSFGVEVTIIEMLPRILPGMDKEISSTLEQILKRKGIEIKTNSSFPPGPWPLVPGPWSPVLLAIGRQIEKIEVNGKMETKDKGIYAVGDVTGLSMYAHSAAMQGIVAAKNICGQEAEMDYGAVPVCVFSFPEAASVGITEEQAAAKGIEVKTGKVNLAAIGKYTTLSEREGFIKVVVDKGTNKLIGCQIIGHGATDLIAEAGLAVRNGLTVEDIRKTIHAHPTLPEAVWEACAINI